MLKNRTLNVQLLKLTTISLFCRSRPPNNSVCTQGGRDTPGHPPSKGVAHATPSTFEPWRPPWLLGVTLSQSLYSYQRPHPRILSLPFAQYHRHCLTGSTSTVHGTFKNEHPFNYPRWVSGFHQRFVEHRHPDCND